jgi:cobalt-zinc-cadmium efflux system membrane fusion protein
MRILALMTLLLALSAQAHEGHEHGDQALAAATALDPRVELHSDRSEVVVVRGTEALLVYADDYDSNAPLEHLAVAIIAGDRRVEAQPLGEGVYRLPLDLLPRTQALQLQLRGEGLHEHFALKLPPAPEATAEPHRRWWPWLAGALALFALAGIGTWRRRSRA